MFARGGVLVLAAMVLLPAAIPAIAEGPLATLGNVEGPGRTTLLRPVHVPSIRATTSANDASLPWWERTSMDLDRDGLADSLELRLDAALSPSPAVTEEGAHQLWPRLPLDAPLQVFVDTDGDPTDWQVEAIAALGLDVVERFDFVDAIQVNDVPPQAIPDLLRIDGVVFVEPRGVPVLAGDIQTPSNKVRDSVEYSPSTAWDLGYLGRNVSIAIMDTGVDNGHPSYAGKWLGGVDVSKPETPLWPRDGTFDADDTQGHATSCTGMAMGTGAPEGTYMGAAPEAKLVDLRIGTIFGAAPGEGPQNVYDATIQGTQWAITHKDDTWAGASPEYSGIEVLSLSWGNNVGGSSDGTDVYSRGMTQLVNAGIVAAVAAGNAGPDNDGFDGLGSSDEVITIGATDDQNTINRTDDVIADYSSRGPRRDDGDGYPYDELKPDVSSSGTDIIQANFDRFGDGSSGTYGPRGSGTSYATPAVAGTIAVMREANTNLTPAVTKEILRRTAERRGDAFDPEVDPFWNKDFGWGIIDGYRATKLASEIDDVSAIDVEVQTFITNVTVGSSALTVSGVAWHRVGEELRAVEVRIDDGPWLQARDEGVDTTFQNW